MKTLLNFAIIFGIVYLLYSFAGVDNSDEQIIKEYEVDEFDQLEFEGPYHIELRQGTKERLEIRASGKVHSEILVSTSGNRLVVSLPEKIVAKKKSIEVYLTIADLSELVLRGSVKLETPERLKMDDLKIDFTGAGDINLNLEVNRLVSDIRGVGSFWLEGKADYHKVIFSGVGSYNAKNFVSRNTSVESGGIGRVEVFALEKFIGNASGVGTIKYFGNPADVIVDASGIGKVCAD